MEITIDEPDFTIKDNIIKHTIVLEDSKESFSAQVLNNLTNTPDFVSQIDASIDKHTTYAEMKDQSIRCALWLRKQGVGYDDIVAHATDNRLGDYIPMLSTAFVGAVYNPWVLDTSRHYAKQLIRLIKPKVMFICERNAEIFLQVARDEGVNTKFIVHGTYLELDSLHDIMKRQSSQEIENFKSAEIANPKEQVAALILTSGTTDVPKCVMHSYDSFYDKRIRAAYPIKNMVSLCYAPLRWYLGSLFVVASLLYQWTRVIDSVDDAERVAQVIEKFKVTHFLGIPGKLMEMYEAKVFSRYDLTSLKIITIGGSRIGDKFVQPISKYLPNTLIVNRYGMTEVGKISATNENCKTLHSVGHISIDAQVRIVDLTTGENLGPYEEGEIRVKTSTMLLGYYKEPDKTKRLFDNEGWVCTKDVGYYNDDGELFVVDRLTNIIRMGTKNISSTQIEEILSSHPAVAEAVVISDTSSVGYEIPVTFIRNFNGFTVSKEELEEFCSTIDDSFTLASNIKFLNNFPRTTVGKIDRRKLKEMILN